MNTGHSVCASSGRRASVPDNMAPWWDRLRDIASGGSDARAWAWCLHLLSIFPGGGIPERL